MATKYLVLVCYGPHRGQIRHAPGPSPIRLSGPTCHPASTREHDERNPRSPPFVAGASGSSSTSPEAKRQSLTIAAPPPNPSTEARPRDRSEFALVGLSEVSMAASSPASSGKAASDSSTVANGNGTTQKPPPAAAAFDMPKPNLRGLNKPKCIQCGNVARSRCPFQCCKSCCYKAQNPCHIHVLKQNNTLPDKPPPTTAPLLEQPSTNSPLTGSSSRLSSLQKLPHHFLNSLRTRKSLAKKDVASINKWRFMKLKEHMQGDIDVENEAYERYTQNIGLLEETFYLTEDSAGEHETEATSSEERMEIMVSEAKVRLKSDCANADSFKERIATILDQKLKKLQGRDSAYEDDSPSVQNLDDHRKLVKLTIKQQMARNAKMNELLGKLTKAQSKDDLKPCLDIMAQLFGKENDSSMGTSNKSSDQESTAAIAPSYSFHKLMTRLEVDENMVSKISDELSSLSQVVQLESGIWTGPMPLNPRGML